MAFVVAQRQREIGIRMALGAEGQRVLKDVLGRGLRLTVFGVVFGLAGAFVATRSLSAMVYGISAHDPVTYAGMTLMLMMVAGLACFIPARRASRVNPVIVLREE